jgi:hypothetical protein
MIIEAGALIVMGFLALALKLPRHQVLILLNHPLKVDLTASWLAFVLHGGSTFTGGMSATVAGLAMSALTTFGRWAVGYIEIEEGYYTYNQGQIDWLRSKDIKKWQRGNRKLRRRCNENYCRTRGLRHA